jgi:hypothetical protein
VRIKELSFRYGKECLATRPEIFASILAAVVNTQEAQLRKPKTLIASHLKVELLAEGWKREILTEKPKQYFDFYKQKVAIETEFSSHEFIYQDFICFLAAYNADKIDVGVIVTNTRDGSNRIKHKSSGPSYERVCEELDWLRPTLIVPLWIIGLK